MSQIPHLLTPYLSLACESSLTLLTSVLGCSTNWLLLRYLQSYLRTASAQENDAEVSVLLVSFLRDAAFWREGSRKLGLDLDKLTMKKRFQYIDGLSSLFLAPPSRNSQAAPNIMVDSDLAHIGAKIKSGIQTLSAEGKKVVLVIDQIDLLLATSSDSDGISSESIGDLLMELRQDAHSMILSVAADTPLVTAQSTPMETSHASFLLSTAHQAELVMGLRLLDTGAARDVSGVCRISVNQDDDEDGPKLEDKELLYYVGADSSVRVFERGT